jgi:hypothetical protein
VGNRQSLFEARSVRLLTLLGMTVLPLSFTSGLFSMSGEYAPGNSHFWVFFAVSVTLIGLIFGITYTLRFWNKETSGGFFRALREGGEAVA